MKSLKKFFALCLTLALVLSLAACAQKPAETTDPAETPDTPAQETEAPVTARIAALKGPTAMGLVKLMSDAPSSANGPLYDFTLAGSADEVTPALIKGELDMACVPANLAAVLYNKTEGAVQVLAVNTLGVLYIVENGESVQSLADLKGKTVVAAGKGSTPEYALRYLLSENGIDPETDVTIQWASEHAECLAALQADPSIVCMLPQPFATSALAKVEGARIALDLTEVWDETVAATAGDSQLITGVAVARSAFASEHPAAVEELLDAYAASVDFVNDDPSTAAQLIEAADIVTAQVAERAIPYCNIVCMTGAEMAGALTGDIQTLYDADPASVGGAMPGDDFCYGA